MRYIDRRFLLPVAAATAWAQQPTPEAAAAEAALRARAEQFFQLQVDKKYRQAESMVADDTKDNYYNGNKFTIKNFSIQKIELLDNNTRARVTIKGRVTLMTPTAPPVDFDAPSTTLWKIENGKWAWYVDTTHSTMTPFGEIKPNNNAAPPPAGAFSSVPDISTLRNLVKIDRTSVDLTADGPVETVTVSNGLPGDIELQLHPDPIPGLSVEMPKYLLKAGEKAAIYFRASTGSKGEGIVRLMVAPIGTQLDIRVRMQ